MGLGMEIKFCGVDFFHKKGEFCPKNRLKFHFISYFRTDFLYEADGELLRGEAGDVLIIPRGELVYHGPVPEAEVGFKNDWLCVDGDDFLEIIKAYPLPTGKPFKVNGRRILSHCIEKIKNEQALLSEGWRDVCELYLKEALIELYRAYSNSGERNSKEKIEALRRELSAHPSHAWTLESMAKFCGYSESRFSALYRDIYQTSPMADLINIRLESAKLMLTYSNLTVSEVAEAVGFSSLYYFSKYFKKSTGKSPSEYKKIW